MGWLYWYDYVSAISPHYKGGPTDRLIWVLKPSKRSHEIDDYLSTYSHQWVRGGSMVLRHLWRWSFLVVRSRQRISLSWGTSSNRRNFLTSLGSGSWSIRFIISAFLPYCIIVILITDRQHIESGSGEQSLSSSVTNCCLCLVDSTESPSESESSPSSSAVRVYSVLSGKALLKVSQSEKPSTKG